MNTGHDIDLAFRPLSISVDVYPSHVDIVSKRLDIQSRCFHLLSIAIVFWCGS